MLEIKEFKSESECFFLSHSRHDVFNSFHDVKEYLKSKESA